MKKVAVLTTIFLIVILIKIGDVQLNKPNNAYVLVAPFLIKRRNKWESQFKYHKQKSSLL